MSGVLQREAMSRALVILPVVVQSAASNSYASWAGRAGAGGRVLGWCGSQCVANTATVFLFFTFSFLLVFRFLSASMPFPFLFLSFPFSFLSFSFSFPVTSRRQDWTCLVRGKYRL